MAELLEGRQSGGVFRTLRWAISYAAANTKAAGLPATEKSISAVEALAWFQDAQRSDQADGYAYFSSILPISCGEGRTQHTNHFIRFVADAYLCI